MPIKTTTVEIFVFLDTIYGLIILSTHDTNKTPYKINAIPENICPDNKRYMEAGI